MTAILTDAERGELKAKLGTIVSPEVDRLEWLRARQDGITATDIAAIVGMHPYRTRLQVWWDKVNRAEHQLEQLDNEAMEWGLRLEEPVAQKFADLHPGWYVDQSPGLIRSASIAGMLATPDRLLTKPDGRRSVLEVKTAGIHQQRRWAEDETPDEYVIQLQWQIEALELEDGYIGSLLVGRHYEERHFKRDKKLLDILIDRAHQFWNDHVVAGVPPVADPFEDAQLLNRIYKVEPGLMVELEGEARAAWENRVKLKEDLEAVTKAIGECEATVKQALGPADVGTIDGEVVCTWREHGRSQLDKDAMTAKHPKLVKRFTHKKPVRALRSVKRKEPSDE
jgi:putative phage-type endonuclease